MNLPSFRVSIYWFWLVLLMVSSISAQTNSRVLQGIVTDETEAIIPAVRLTLRDERGAVRQSKSDDNGNFHSAN